MMVGADAPTWAVDRDRVWHVSESNLPVGAYTPGGVTFCHARMELSRADRQPSPRHHDVCGSCVAELLTMGERLPTWLERRAR
jgi:hypothetical protein